MKKIALGLITALLLASCAFTPNYSKVATSGAGHPDVTYPGPRAY
jgi:hypothetical protein